MNRLNNNMDIQILITAANSERGVGKSTLAIELCRFIDRHGWSAEEKAFVNTQEYIDAHMNEPPGTALLYDEIEGGADSRRANSHENVELSQAWAKLRARNIATVATLPTASMLDKRMLELADWHVIVQDRGVAQPFQIHVNDFNPHKLPQRKPLPGNERIQFKKLPEDDTDKKYLDDMKDEMLESEGPDYVRRGEHQKKIEKVEEETRRSVRNKALVALDRHSDLTRREMEELEFVDVNHSQVTEIINNNQPT